jgi:hypothetical protein
VCALAWRVRTGNRLVTGAGALAAAAATLALIVRLVRTDPIAIAFLAVLVLVAIFGRPVLLRHFATKPRQE